MKFAADVVEADGTSYHVENTPQNMVMWEAKAEANNVTKLQKLTAIMQVLHIAAYEQKLTTHKAWTDYLTNIKKFDLSEVGEVGPTSQAASDDSNSLSLSALA